MEQLMHIIPRGLAIGILISAPMGPVGMLCIQRTLNKGQLAGFFTGIGAAVSDLVYCFITGLGLSLITDFIETHDLALKILGSLVLIAFGIYLFKKNPTRSLKPANEQSNNFWGDFVSGFFFTLSNPLILFFIIGLFARFNFFQADHKVYHYAIGYISIFAGAILWWYMITLLINFVRTRFNVRSMWLVNRITGSILIAMALIGFILGIKDYISL